MQTDLLLHDCSGHSQPGYSGISKNINFAEGKPMIMDGKSLRESSNNLPF